MSATEKRKANSNWIASLQLDKHKGALHSALKVPAGMKIPIGKLKTAASGGDSKLAKRARLALTFRSFKH